MFGYPYRYGSYGNNFNANQTVPYDLELIEPPHEESVSLREVKDFLYVTHDEDDALLYSFIIAAREACEQYTNRSLLLQTWEISYDEFFIDKDIPLKRGPAIEIEEVTYEKDGNTITVDPAHYKLVKKRFHGHVCIDTDLHSNLSNQYYVRDLKVRFTAGYGDQHDAIPGQMRLGILQYICNLYERRDEDALSMGVKNKWDQYRLVELH